MTVGPEHEAIRQWTILWGDARDEFDQSQMQITGLCFARSQNSGFVPGGNQCERQG
jgi:hypothetical protein